MDAITGVTTGGVSGVPENASVSKGLGEDDFLNLLLRQLENQDPLNPLKGEELAAQLAQFTSVQELQNINRRLEVGIQSDNLLGQAISNSLATGLLAKHVRVATDAMSLGDSGPARFLVLPESHVARMSVRIYNEYGQLVTAYQAGAANAEVTRVEWDGATDAGPRAARGVYRVEVSATNDAGDSVPVEVMNGGLVDGIRYNADGAWLTVGDDLYSVADVAEVSTQEPAWAQSREGALSSAARGVLGLFDKIIP